jgi:hypothetical protein
MFLSALGRKIRASIAGQAPHLALRNAGGVRIQVNPDANGLMTDAVHAGTGAVDAMLVVDCVVTPDLDLVYSSGFAIGTGGTGSISQLVYDEDTGTLSFDANGVGAGAPVVLARLDSHLDLTASNIRCPDAHGLGADVPDHGAWNFQR